MKEFDKLTYSKWSKNVEDIKFLILHTIFWKEENEKNKMMMEKLKSFLSPGWKKK